MQYVLNHQRALLCAGRAHGTTFFRFIWYADDYADSNSDDVVGKSSYYHTIVKFFSMGVLLLVRDKQKISLLK